MATSEYRQYDHLEHILQRINGDYVRLNEDEKRRNNMVLKVILYHMNKDQLFNSLIRKEFYGGSYYDDLKVSKPNEYDLDLLLHLPPYTCPVISASEMPGYVKIELENIRNFERKKDESDRYPNLALKLLDGDNYLSTTKILAWMESVLTKALNDFNILSKKYHYVKKLGTTEGVYYFTVRKQGPAFTLKINGLYDQEVIKIDVDLVPCFVFTVDKLPEDPYRNNQYYMLKNEFFIVPKKPKNAEKDHPKYWRLSFQEQESAIIRDKARLKPALRLIKKLRDSSGHDSIASYYIKTVFLMELINEDPCFWNRSLSYVFMTMLKKYQKYLEDGDIPYFWNRENNLLCYLHFDTSVNISNSLKSIIKKLGTSRDPQQISGLFERVIPDSKPDYWSQVEDLPPERSSSCVIS
ncbi:hypothetical protein ILUMI_09402 [Ignelater luminosus]|uniref:Cyclic GMP-AMP synthase n=1 Tax=Ignelater luminosus TaxID=2038154 RepID=A0A8K0D028_IGNLU|nr:hypothetical protein ILUMI_09402 [Ignelater luminosus]